MDECSGIKIPILTRKNAKLVIFLVKFQCNIYIWVDHLEKLFNCDNTHELFLVFGCSFFFFFISFVLNEFLIYEDHWKV